MGEHRLEQLVLARREVQWFAVASDPPPDRVQLQRAHAHDPLLVSLAEGSGTPAHQMQAHSGFALTRRINLDTFAYAVSRIQPQVPAYLRLDVRLAWRPLDILEVAVGGRNLLDPQHPEFIADDLLQSSQIRRSAYVRLTWRF